MKKKIAADFSLIPLELQLLVINNIALWISRSVSNHAILTKAREQRLGFILLEVERRVEKNNVFLLQSEVRGVGKGETLSTDVNNKLTSALKGYALTASYTEEGLEGTIEDKDNKAIGIWDYISSRTATPFEGAGFSAKTFAVQGFTDDSATGGKTPMQKLADKLIDIGKNGNY